MESNGGRLAVATLNPAALVFTGERHKYDRHDLAGCQLTFEAFSDHAQLLNLENGANRNHHYAAGFQLLHQWWRNVAAGSRHDDGFKERVLLPAEITIGVPDLDIGKSKALQKP